MAICNLDRALVLIALVPGHCLPYMASETSAVGRKDLVLQHSVAIIAYSQQALVMKD